MLHGNMKELHVIVLTVAAAESALGLAILIVYYRVRGGIALDTVQTLRS
jgi:NADH:ubiquinone oxidoreductase subunit K